MVQRRREADEGGVGVRGEGRRRKLVLRDLQKAGRQAQETFHVQDGGAGGRGNVSCNGKEKGQRCFFLFFLNPPSHSKWEICAVIYLLVTDKPGILTTKKRI